MEKISSIDLMVHPFFTHVSCCTKLAQPFTTEEADTFLEMWKGEIDQIKKDRGRILVMIGGFLTEERFGAIKKGEKTNPKGYEPKLAEYSSKELDGRLFFFYDTLEGKPLEQVKRMLAGAVKVCVYGEWTSACCFREAELLSKKLGIPRKSFSFLPKKSADLSIGYPRKRELVELMKLPRKERAEILRERMGTYTDRLREFRGSG